MSNRENKTSRFVIRCGEDLRDALQQIAEREQGSASAVARRALLAFIQTKKREGQKAGAAA